MFKNLSGDERKFVYFWLLVLGSVMAGWVVAVRWVWGVIAGLLA